MHVYKLILVFQGKENEINQQRTYQIIRML